MGLASSSSQTTWIYRDTQDLDKVGRLLDMSKLLEAEASREVFISIGLPVFDRRIVVPSEGVAAVRLQRSGGLGEVSQQNHIQQCMQQYIL